MLIELSQLGLSCEKQRQIQVFYKDQRVGKHFADIIVEGVVIVELKAAELLAEEHAFQLINYLKATQIEVGLLLNVGKSPQFKRRVFSNPRRLA